MNLSEALQLKQLEHRLAFEEPRLVPVAFSDRYDRTVGKYVVSRGSDRLFAVSLQVVSLARGQAVDLVGRRIDYL